MTTLELEKILGPASNGGFEDGSDKTLDVYMAGLAHMYTGPPEPPGGLKVPGGTGLPKKISELINKGYGQHENKLIDENGITTVYTDFQKDRVKVDIFDNDLGNSHKDKLHGLDVEIPYKDMFPK